VLLVLVVAVVLSMSEADEGRAYVGHPIRGVVALVGASAPEDDIFNGQFCGGVLTRTNQVLTAAHCVVGREAANTHAVVGADNLCRLRPIDGIRRRVLSISVHPHYNRVAGAFDLAELTLDGHLPADRVRSIAAPELGDIEATALGWGRTSVGGIPSCRLSRALMSLRATADCEAVASTSDRPFDSGSMLCAMPASEASGDTCAGDSGGPLILGRDLDSGPIIGIVSWGRGCGAGWPGVYAKASAWN
jgi:secreted trypsin-like serine protease